MIIILNEYFQKLFTAYQRMRNYNEEEDSKVMCKEVITMTLFDQTASTYDEWCKTPLGQLVDRMEKQMMVQLANPKQGEKALDLGCGTGIYTFLLSEMGVEATGIDISTAMLEAAKQKVLQKKQQVDFILGDIQDLPFPDQSFDLVISNIVLEFVESPKKVISEALRVLKPNGRLIIGFIGKDSDWARIYQKQGKEKLDSVFANAHFYNAAQIQELSGRRPIRFRFGLYFSPTEFHDADQAMMLEKERAWEQKEDGAGFMAVKWTK